MISQFGKGNNYKISMSAIERKTKSLSFRHRKNSSRKSFLSFFNWKPTSPISEADLNRGSFYGKDFKLFTLLDQCKLMLGAAKGLAFLHSKGYMHCDIKSPNFLITKVV